MPVAPDNLATRIDALLPQTQCTRCGYPACLDYARAIAGGDADINQCPPGGSAGIALLAELTGRPAKPLNPANGIEQAPHVALIDEEACIGCMKCIQACPVDAIVGASKSMHTVLADECDGCELCIPPCPVDCIAMVPIADTRTPLQRAPQFRERFDARKARLARDEAERMGELEAKKASIAATGGSTGSVQAAIERARARRHLAASAGKR